MDAPPSTTELEGAGGEPPEIFVEPDSPHVPLEELVTALVVADGQIIDEEVGLAVTLDKIATDFPIELRIEQGLTGLLLTTAPPTQHVETTILPVWHQLRITIERNHDDDTENDEHDAAR
jgi:hypothetical protein